jgi:predicted PurR-regulated permease PerM
MDTEHTRAYFLAIVTTLLTVLTVYMIRPYLVTIGLAAVFAVILAPLQSRFKRYKLNNTLAAMATVVVGVVVFAIVLIAVGVQLFREAENIYLTLSQPGTVTSAQSAITSIGHSLSGTIPGADTYFSSVANNVGTYARRGLSWVLGYAATFFSGTLTFLLELFIFIMTLYYLLKEGRRIERAIAQYSPLTEEETTALISRMKATIASVVRGSLLVAVTQGALTGLGFLIFGISNPILWGTVAIIAALIPSVGTGFVFVPAVLYLLYQGHTGMAIGLGIYGAFGVGMVDNVLRPILMSGRASIHPLLILLSVIGGLSFFGFAGLFLGPLVVSLLLGILSLYATARKEQTA